MIAPLRNSRLARSTRRPRHAVALREGGFALVVTLVIVAVLAVIAVGVFTSTSLERATAKSYDNRYQAELAIQNGLQAFEGTLVATTFPSPAPTASPFPVTSLDTFLIVTAANGSAAYYYLAQPTDLSQQTASSVGSSSITYYPLFSSSTNPSAPAVQTATINLTATPAPAVPTPAPPANSTASDSTSAWNTAKTQRLPTLYSWAQPTPSPSGPSVKWVETHDPQETATAAPYNYAYTRYAYWAEDLDGYLDASQVNDPNAVNTRANGTSTGTSPGEIAMFTIFAPTQQTVNPTPAPVINLLGSTETLAQNQRPLLFTVPTVQQIAATTPDLAGPNLAVRLGMDNSPGEQNLVPFGYGYDTAGQAKSNLNYYTSYMISKQNAQAATQFPLASPSPVLPRFQNRSNGTGTVDYPSNLLANIADYASPQNAPTGFTGTPSYRGIGAYPFVVSLYDLNWADTYLSSSTGTYHILIEVNTYVQLWNPHNITIPPGVLTVQYQNSDQVSYNGKSYPLATPPPAMITFKTGAPSDPTQPVVTSTLTATGKKNKSFSYPIIATVGNCAPMQPNSYLVVVLPQPTVSSYNATGLPSGLTVNTTTGVISGTPTTSGTYNVTISATNSNGTTGSATLVITISP